LTFNTKNEDRANDFTADDSMTYQHNKMTRTVNDPHKYSHVRTSADVLRSYFDGIRKRVR